MKSALYTLSYAPLNSHLRSLLIAAIDQCANPSISGASVKCFRCRSMCEWRWSKRFQLGQEVNCGFYTCGGRGEGRYGCANEQHTTKHTKRVRVMMMMINEASKHRRTTTTTTTTTTTIGSRQSTARDNSSSNNNNNANNTHAGNSRTCLCHNFKLLSHAQRTDNASDGGSKPRETCVPNSNGNSNKQQQQQRATATATATDTDTTNAGKDTNTFSRYSSQQPLSYTRARCHKVQQLGGRRGNRRCCCRCCCCTLAFQRNWEAERKRKAVREREGESDLSGTC